IKLARRKKIRAMADRRYFGRMAVRLLWHRVLAYRVRVRMPAAPDAVAPRPGFPGQRCSSGLPSVPFAALLLRARIAQDGSTLCQDYSRAREALDNLPSCAGRSRTLLRDAKAQTVHALQET